MGWFTGFIKLSYTFHIQWHKKFKLFVKCLPLLQASLLTALIQAGLSFTVIDQDKTGSCMTCVLSSEHQRAYWSWLDWTGTSTQCHCLSSKQVINTLPVPLLCHCQSWFGDTSTGSGATQSNLKEGQIGLASDLLDYYRERPDRHYGPCRWLLWPQQAGDPDVTVRPVTTGCE